jgi:hypothetical protein
VRQFLSHAALGGFPAGQCESIEEWIRAQQRESVEEWLDCAAQVRRVLTLWDAIRSRDKGDLARMVRWDGPLARITFTGPSLIWCAHQAEIIPPSMPGEIVGPAKFYIAEEYNFRNGRDGIANSVNELARRARHPHGPGLVVSGDLVESGSNCNRQA